MRKRNSILLLACGAWASVPANAVTPSYPTWWLEQGVVDPADYPPPAEGDPDYDAWMADNYKVPNLGQAKTLARAAYLAMEAEETGSAGPAIQAMVNGFSTNPTDNYAAVNIGQIKALAKPFYDKMHAEYFEVILADGTILQSGYPWDADTPVDDNYALANLGQLKHVFSFDLSNWSPSPPVDEFEDLDGDLLDDSWEMDVWGTTAHDRYYDGDNEVGDGIFDYMDADPTDSSVGILLPTIVIPSDSQIF